MARLRLAYDPEGKRLVPTTEEAQTRAEQKRREAEQWLKEEAERRATAEARARELEDKLKRLGRS